jgi:hypothetical protein
MVTVAFVGVIVAFVGLALAAYAVYLVDGKQDSQDSW